MTNLTLPINSSRIKTCEYNNCTNTFIRRSNNHKYCKEHENVNSRKDNIKSKKRKYKDENNIENIPLNINNEKISSNSLLSNNELKAVKKENEILKSVKKEYDESKTLYEQNTPASTSKKPNLLDILIKRTSSEPYNCIGKNKPFHINNIPQKVDKCIQTDDLFEFIPKVKKVKVDKSVGTDNDTLIEPLSPVLDVMPSQQFTTILDTPTKNIQSLNNTYLPLSIKRNLRNSSDSPLRDISNVINSRYLKSPISGRKSPKILSKINNKYSEFDAKNKENFNFNVTPIKNGLNDSTSYRAINDSLSYLSSTNIPIGEGPSTSIFNTNDPSFTSLNPLITNNNLNVMNGLGNESSNYHSPASDEYYMDYLKILKKISKFSPSQELKQTLSLNSNLSSINNHSILSPAKTDPEDLLAWLNIE